MKHRFSGEVLTAHGNTLINALLLKYAFGNNLDQLIVEGDDGLASLKKFDKEIIADAECKLSRLGFSVKMKASKSLHGAEFLKQTFILTEEDSYAWYRKPARALYKIGWSDKNTGHFNSKTSRMIWTMK